jgi:hypothetical protein
MNPPEWLKSHAVLVAKKSCRVAEITGFTEQGNPILEFDDDGSVHDYFSIEEVARDFEPWREGMRVVDRTGKGRFANPKAWRS